MEYCSDIKKNDILVFAPKWLQLEIMMLTEMWQASKRQIYICVCVCMYIYR